MLILASFVESEIVFPTVAIGMKRQSGSKSSIAGMCLCLIIYQSGINPIEICHTYLKGFIFSFV